MNSNFGEWLKLNDWKVEENLVNSNRLDIDVLKQYKNIPLSFLEFLEHFNSITSQDETTWFICADDYNGKNEDAFRWNEFELMSLEAAEGDEEWEKEIKEWWKYKLPILLSVKDRYSFYAIDLIDNSGSIVRGEEPEFEEAYIVANSFDEFLDMIMNNGILLGDSDMISGSMPDL